MRPLKDNNHQRSPCPYGLLARSRWSNQRGSDLIGTRHLDTAWSRVGMVGGQSAAPGKAIGANGLSWAEGDAGRGRATSIVDGIGELNGPARAVGRHINGSRVGDNH